jgi:hypothetical protein
MSCNVCGNDPPPAPPPVDAAAAAAAQGQANVEAARTSTQLNRPDINSWNGSQTWTKDPNNPDHYIQTNTLSPAEQQKYDKGNAVQNSMLDLLSGQGMTNIQDAMSGKYTLPGSYQTVADGPTARNVQYNLDTSGAPQGQSRLDFSGAPGMPQNDTAARDQTMNAEYSKGARYLDSQYDSQQKSLEAKLANQGIAPGSEAYKQAMQDFGDQKARDYGNLRDSSIGLGNTELNASFNRGLSSRQEGVNEATTQGQFANSARQQAVNELLQSMQSRNAAVAQGGNMANQAMTSANAGRSAQLQELISSKTLPINVLTALLSGSQVNAPQFQPFNNAQNVEAAPIMQGAQLQNQQLINSTNAQSAQNGQTCGTIGTVATAAAAAY